ncbi:MAG: biotin--[acetyl-CoA-carboxylase] ligase [Alphaproteobacteria bacterium]
MTIDWTIHSFDSVDSTQDVIKGMGRLHQPEGQVAHAFEQKKGQGRHGRPWVSEKGNLYLSLLLRPDCHVSEVTQMALVTAIAVAETMRTYMKEPERLTLKWPNDVLIDGQKCAGILLETDLNENSGVKWLAIGVGMNITNPPLGLGVALQDYCEQILDLIAIRSHFLNNMARLYKHWNIEKFTSIRERWLALAHKKNTPIEVKIGVQIERGFFHDLDSRGNLIIRNKDYRTKTVSAGEIHFLDKDI